MKDAFDVLVWSFWNDSMYGLVSEYMGFDGFLVDLCSIKHTYIKVI